MSSVLDNTYGVWLAALFFESILYGMGILQVYLYFFWYSDDGWGTKASVILITALETVQTGAFFAATYEKLITGFGNFPNLQIITTVSLVQLLALYTSAFVAQTFFAHCIYLLHDRRVLFPLFLVLLSLAALGAAIGQIVVASRLQSFEQLSEDSAPILAQAGLVFACDVLITVGLCWRLNTSKSAIQSTNRLINFLIMTAINRGVLTMVTALLDIVLFLLKPGTFYFMFAILISGKLYLNSMLAMLNTRHHAFSLGQERWDSSRTRTRTTDLEAISMPVFQSGRRAPAATCTSTSSVTAGGSGSGGVVVNVGVVVNEQVEDEGDRDTKVNYAASD